MLRWILLVPAHAGPAGSPFFCVDFLEYFDVQCRLGQQLLEPVVLQLQGLQSFDVPSLHLPEVFAPCVPEASLTLCFFAASTTLVRSAPRSTATICASVNCLFLISSSCVGSYLPGNYWSEEIEQVGLDNSERFKQPHSSLLPNVGCITASCSLYMQSVALRASIHGNTSLINHFVKSFC
jgi:hypothetical protein